MERVIELANEANKDVGYKFQLEDAKKLHDLLDKFAALVAKDCASIADLHAAGGAGSEFDVGYISCANTVSEQIKERFGVEL